MVVDNKLPLSLMTTPATLPQNRCIISLSCPVTDFSSAAIELWEEKKVRVASMVVASMLPLSGTTKPASLTQLHQCLTNPSCPVTKYFSFAAIEL